MQSLRGQLLTATPQLADENFARSVVLLLEHNEQGALGVLLNRPGDRSVANIWKEIEKTPCHNREPIFLGGPVAGPLLALHTRYLLGEREIFSGLFLSTERHNLNRLISVTSEEPYRIYLGNSGWGPGQLERELSEGSWHIEEATAEDIFSEPEKLWQKISRKIGRRFYDETLGINQLPDDPTVN
jgi:putative transcriptional regulator